jgi:hypothetical protein
MTISCVWGWLLTSERGFLATATLTLALGAGCADFGRGEPRPDTAAVASTDAAAADSSGITDTASGPTFARDVHHLMVDGCVSCHRSGGAAASSAFLLVDDAGKDRLQVLAQVNPDKPAASRLLAKAAGLGHGGGAIYPTGSAEYRTILEWIMQGSVP